MQFALSTSMWFEVPEQQYTSKSGWTLQQVSNYHTRIWKAGYSEERQGHQFDVVYKPRTFWSHELPKFCILKGIYGPAVEARGQQERVKNSHIISFPKAPQRIDISSTWVQGNLPSCNMHVFHNSMALEVHCITHAVLHSNELLQYITNEATHASYC